MKETFIVCRGPFFYCIVAYDIYSTKCNYVVICDDDACIPCNKVFAYIGEIVTDQVSQQHSEWHGCHDQQLVLSAVLSLASAGRSNDRPSAEVQMPVLIDRVGRFVLRHQTLSSLPCHDRERNEIIFADLHIKSLLIV